MRHPPDTSNVQEEARKPRIRVRIPSEWASAEHNVHVYETHAGFITRTEANIVELREHVRVTEEAKLNMYRLLDGNMKLPWVLLQNPSNAQNFQTFDLMMAGTPTLKLLRDWINERTGLSLDDMPIMDVFPLVSDSTLKALSPEKRKKVTEIAFRITMDLIWTYRPSKIILMQCHSKYSDQEDRFDTRGQFKHDFADDISSSREISFSQSDGLRKLTDRVAYEHFIRDGFYSDNHSDGEFAFDIVMCRHPYGIGKVKVDAHKDDLIRQMVSLLWVHYSGSFESDASQDISLHSCYKRIFEEKRRRVEGSPYGNRIERLSLTGGMIRRLCLHSDEARPPASTLLQAPADISSRYLRPSIPVADVRPASDMPEPAAATYQATTTSSARADPVSPPRCTQSSRVEGSGASPGLEPVTPSRQTAAAFQARGESPSPSKRAAASRVERRRISPVPHPSALRRLSINEARAPPLHAASNRSDRSQSIVSQHREHRLSATPNNIPPDHVPTSHPSHVIPVANPVQSSCVVDLTNPGSAIGPAQFTSTMAPMDTSSANDSTSVSPTGGSPHTRPIIDLTHSGFPRHPSGPSSELANPSLSSAGNVMNGSSANNSTNVRPTSSSVHKYPGVDSTNDSFTRDHLRTGSRFAIPNVSSTGDAVNRQAPIDLTTTSAMGNSRPSRSEHDFTHVGPAGELVRFAPTGDLTYQTAAGSKIHYSSTGKLFVYDRAGELVHLIHVGAA